MKYHKRSAARIGYILLSLVVVMLAATVALQKNIAGKAQAEQAKGKNHVLSRYVFANLVDKLRPSVVNIYTTQVIKGSGAHPFFHFGPGPRGGNPDSDRGRRNPFFDFFGDDFFKRFYDNAPQGDIKRTSLGSGFIISKDGYIVTNNHVVDKASEIKVKLLNEEEYEAKVIGKDKKTDLALIKIDPKKDDLKPARFGKSDNLMVGEWVVAIGNPFGLSNSVTAGIVSAQGRHLNAGPYDDFIQTDASINPGNSGGPLINLDGEVVGVNTAIIARAQGIGFAIPIDLAKSIIDQLKTKGKVTRGWLGVSIQEITSDLKKSFGLKSNDGALVSEVFEDTPADKADIKRGDVIIKFDGKPIEKYSDLSRVVADTPVDKTVKIELLRNNKKKVITVKIGEMKDTEEPVAIGAKGDDTLGLMVQDLTDDLRRSLELEKDEKGVLVSSVDPSSLAFENGIRNGDLIKEFGINGKRQIVESVKEFRKMVKKAGKGDSLLFLIKRGNSTIYIAFQVE